MTDFAYGAMPRKRRFALNPVDVLTFIIVGYAMGILTPDYTTFVTQSEYIENAARSAAAGGSNRFNQIFWVLATGVMGFVVLRTGQLRATIAAAAPLLPFLMFAVASVLWSADSSATLRRTLLVAFALFCYAGLAASSHSLRDLWRVIYVIAWVMAIQALLALPLPTTWDYSGNFRGPHGDKNAMGIHSALGMMIAIGAGSFARPIDRARNRWLLYGLLSVILIVSNSKTSMAMAFAVTFLAFVNSVWNRSMSSRARTAGLVLLFTPLSIAAFFLILNINYLMQALFSRFTFTGRTAIWAWVDTEVQQHFFLGSGYGAFWGIGAASPNLSSPFPFVRHLNQAHNGYMDIQVQLGAIGMTVFVLSMVYVFFMLVSARLRNVPGMLMAWCLIYFALLHNFLESTLWRNFNHIWAMFMFAVISLALERYRRREAAHAAQAMPAPLHMPQALRR